jgi:hypothetical protein
MKETYSDGYKGQALVKVIIAEPRRFAKWRTT